MQGLELRTWYPLRATCRRLPKAGAVYVLRCTINGKFYVGKSVDVQRRAYKHCRPEHFNSLVSRAVQAHGADAFEIQLWCLGEDEAALLATEVELIAQLGTRAPAGYNLTAGGEGSSGYRHSPEVLTRIAAANTGKVRPASAVAATAAANRGRVRSAESLERMSAVQVGRKHSDATRAKMSEARVGKLLSATTRERISKQLTGNPKVQKQAQVMALARQRVVLVWPPGSMVALEFTSVKEAGEWFGKQRSDISNYCRGAQPRSGHQFAYLK